jgi:D-amino-acid dehydrogenase
MPDMMPKVGRGRQANVFYNTGHGHLGWTLSAATASLLAEEMCQAESARVAKGKAILSEPLAST